jgi:hypothetical protein
MLKAFAVSGLYRLHAPSNSCVHFLLLLCATQVGDEGEAAPHLAAYVSSVRRCFSIIDAFYTELGLHFPDKA